MGAPDPADGVSLYWKLVSRNKRCCTIDLKSDEGRSTVLRLVREAHVVIENFRPGTLERLGLGPDVLLAENPRLVVTRVTGFGQDGPYSGRLGFRSEEHTSELQSLMRISYAVFCLKKKNNT